MMFLMVYKTLEVRRVDMNSKLSIGTWKEDICPEEKIDFSTESFGEMLEKINFGEKNNIHDNLMPEWCEEYISEMHLEGLDVPFEVQNYYEAVL